jgi:hypothetical protein
MFKTVALDCIVGNWGSWSAPDNDGICQRKRPIIRYQINKGAPCPSTKQTKTGMK